MWGVISASCGRDTDGASLATVVAAPWSSSDLPDQEKISEAKEKLAEGDNAAKRNHLAKGDPGIKKQDTGKGYIASDEYPRDLPEYILREVRRGKNKYLWERVKQMIVRFASPLLGWM